MGWDTPLGAVAHLMPTRSVLNEIESCCGGPLTSTRKVYFYKKSRREKGENGFEEEGERERRWIEKKGRRKNV
jgi:hypothetical protein